MSHLIPCPDCGRHARASEPECPFCAAPLPLDSSPPLIPRRRLGRAAIFAFGGLALGAAAVGCGDDSGPMPLYGGPPGPGDAGPADDAGDPVAPAYGAPAP